MLTDKDIEFMKKSHEQIYTKRTHEVLLCYEEVDEYQGPMGYPDFRLVKEPAKAVITHLSRMSNLHRRLVDSAEIEDGDIHVDVSEEYLRGLDDLPQQVHISEMDKEGEFTKYEIISANPKGIGVRNRVEFWARLIK